jgi:homoserine dehydrogenase
MRAADKPGVLADVSRILADQGISIEAVLQKEPAAGEAEATIIMLTHRVLERAMNGAIRRIEALGSIAGGVKRIRMETMK